MTDKKYGFKSHKLGVKENVRVGDPFEAFRLYVAPGLNNSAWIEQSKPVTDTGMSMREWAGQAPFDSQGHYG